MTIVSENQKAEVSLSVNSIAEARAQFANIVSPTMQRATQASDSIRLKELVKKWNEADTMVQQNLSIGVKLDVLSTNFRTLLEAGKALLNFIEVNTQLDVSNQLENFQKLYQVWEGIFNKSEIVKPGYSNEAFLRSLDARVVALEEVLAETRVSLITLTRRFQTLEDSIGSEIVPHKQKYDQFISEYDAAKPAIDKRIAELDELLGLQGKKVLAGRFEKDANNEEKDANLFRKGAIAVMVLAISVITLSYYELAQFDLNPSGAAIRIIFSLILSVPAAYLARESSKHRQRQYWLRQTALEIGAIDPYIATLPAEAQHKIKEETATKLFTPKPQEGFDKDSYPVNAQELLIKMIEAIGNKIDKPSVKKDPKRPEE